MSMELDTAKDIAEKFVEINADQFERVEICGSIRRNNNNVNDIDLVVIPKHPDNFLLDYNATVRGRKRVEIPYHNGIKIDIYVADQDNFEVLKLIRTGSAEHNIKLCQLAIEKGWKLKANGEGLITSSETIKTERGILEALLGKYIEPEDRT
jgi:DNA polymerase/3'-5' exonuclease PolX